MEDFSALKQSIETYIKNNGNKEITGAILQNILLSMVITMGDQAINNLSQILSNEVTARGNADGLLSQALTEEQQRAIAAETKSAVLDVETNTLVFKNAAGQELYQVSVASLVSNGLVDVEVDGTNLVMTFHTESGDKEITIPIGDIFNPSNYYTKTQVDGLLQPLISALNAVATKLSYGGLYMGVATTETEPSSHTGQKQFYIAMEAGEYHFLDGEEPIVIAQDGLYILAGGIEGDDWYLETIVTFTNNVQFNNPRLITSGGVFNAILPINELLHRNYILAGVADTTTIPTEDTNVFYLAGQGGTYTHFLNGSEEPLVLPKGLTVIYRGVEDDGWNYWTVYADNDFINTNRAQELSSAQKSLARTNMDVYSKAETYTKTELNNLITTPNQEYVTVVATAQTTAVTDLLPATGIADTIYRVGCWDGTQYNDSVFSEYAWNGSAYIKLSTKSQIGEVYDISANHADTKYADLAAALGTNGANIPQSLQKGGMSVKFVSSVDNNYVQFRCMSQSFTTNTSWWQSFERTYQLVNGEIKKECTLSFIDGTYKIQSGTAISDGSHSAIATIVVPVNAGVETIDLKLSFNPTVGEYGSYFVFAINDSTAAINSDDIVNYVQLIDANEHLYRLTIPVNTTKVFSACFIADKQTIYANEIGLIKESNLDQVLKDKINNPEIKGSNIDGTAETEDVTNTISFIDDYYKSQDGTTIETIGNNSLATIVVPVNNGENTVYLKLSFNPTVGEYGSYFIFSINDSTASIDSTDIINYVQLIDSDEHIYRLTVPANTTKIYSACFKIDKQEIKAYKNITKMLDWLLVDESNLNQELKDKINNSSTQNHYRLWDSIRKPINFTGKKLVAFGDSITEGVASPGLVNAGENKYIAKFCGYVGAQLYANNAVESTCLAGSASNSIRAKVLSYTGDADIIWIAGGTNDWNTGKTVGAWGSTDISTVYGALKSICEYLTTNYPNAVVIFVTPIPYTVPESNFPNHITSLDAYRTAIYDVATSYGFNVVDGAHIGMPEETGGWNDVMCSPYDGCHPTVEGHKLMARGLTGKLC